jgi:hypothetical protein
MILKNQYYLVQGFKELLRVFRFDKESDGGFDIWLTSMFLLGSL